MCPLYLKSYKRNLGNNAVKNKIGKERENN